VRQKIVRHTHSSSDCRPYSADTVVLTCQLECRSVTGQCADLQPLTVGQVQLGMIGQPTKRLSVGDCTPGRARCPVDHSTVVSIKPVDQLDFNVLICCSGATQQ
jgi:hypothetical protein